MTKVISSPAPASTSSRRSTTPTPTKNPAAVSLGRLGGLSRSEAKIAAVQANIKIAQERRWAGPRA